MTLIYKVLLKRSASHLRKDTPRFLIRSIGKTSLSSLPGFYIPSGYPELVRVSQYLVLNLNSPKGPNGTVNEDEVGRATNWQPYICHSRSAGQAYYFRECLSFAPLSLGRKLQQCQPEVSKSTSGGGFLHKNELKTVFNQI